MTYDTFGRRFETITFPDNNDKVVNDFIEATPGYGVLAVADGLVHVAKLSDKGIKL